MCPVNTKFHHLQLDRGRLTSQNLWRHWKTCAAVVECFHVAFIYRDTKILNSTLWTELLDFSCYLLDFLRKCLQGFLGILGRKMFSGLSADVLRRDQLFSQPRIHILGISRIHIRRVVWFLQSLQCDASLSFFEAGVFKTTLENLYFYRFRFLCTSIFFCVENKNDNLMHKNCRPRRSPSRVPCGCFGVWRATRACLGFSMNCFLLFPPLFCIPPNHSLILFW